MTSARRLGCISLVAWFMASGCAPHAAPFWPDIAFESDGSSPAELRVGVAARPITPTRLLDVFLAGGLPYRRALRVHDELWARAIVLEDGAHRVALVALDLIGLYYDDVVRIRAAVAERVAVDYVLVACTHTHSAPDLLGHSAPLPGRGSDPYKPGLIAAVAEAVVEAVAAARPARIRIAVGDSGTPALTHDTRFPFFIDDTLTAWQALEAETGAVLVTAVHYASHPILVPAVNFDISADFVHYLRSALESGMAGDDGPVEAEGGLCVFLNGALGGRITPAHAEPLTQNATAEGDYQRAQAYGYRLARRVQGLLRGGAEVLEDALPLAVAARRIGVPISNDLLYLGTITRALPRAIDGLTLESEVAILRIGPMALFAAPGMIFPELVRGGYAPIAGSDLPDAPPDGPALADLSGGRYFILVGLANDMLGNIIPQALWDQERPFSSPDRRRPYGEVISPGPATAGVVIDAFSELAGDRRR